MRPKPFTGNVKYGKEKPDMKIDPRKSVILEIRAAEITKSNTYDVGCTLRYKGFLYFIKTRLIFQMRNMYFSTVFIT